MEADRGEVDVQQPGEHPLVQLGGRHALAEVARDDAIDQRDEAPERILLLQSREQEERSDEIHGLDVPHDRVVRGVRREDVTKRFPHG